MNLIRCLSVLIFALCIPSNQVLADATLSISDKIIFAMKAGEAQSTVIAPNINLKCPAGRLLVSNDFLVRRTPYPDGAVVWRDLTDLDGNTGKATFGGMPNAQYFTMGTDHDLVSLKDGTVLLIDMVSSKAPISPKPQWFDDTYRDNKNSGDFGPGARTAIGIWRSTDCGTTFSFASLIETADYGDGSCAWPQRPEWNPDAHHPLDMGGSDGISARVTADRERVIIVNQCVGYMPDPNVHDAFVLTNKRIDKSLVFESADKGLTWKFVATFPKAAWRRSFVDHGQNVDFAVGPGVSVGTRQQNGTLDVASTAQVVPNAGQGGLKTAGAGALDATYGNIWGHVILTHVPGTKRTLIAEPVQMTRASSNVNSGYRVFLYDHSVEKFAELPPILPASDQPDNFMMHLVAIDLGIGPVLLYWSEFDLATKTALVRGRFIFNRAEFSDDFIISRQNGQTATWALDPNAHYWYGDYQTASAYMETTSAGPPGDTVTFDYFPMWIEANRTVDAAHIRVTVPDKNGVVNKFAGDGSPSVSNLPFSDFSIVARNRELSEIEEDDADESASEEH